MGNELIYSKPEQEGVSSELIINYLNEVEKAGAEIHGIMILRNNKVIFEGYSEPYRKEIPHIMHSFTKCLTNMAVGLAYSNRLLRLTDKVLDFLPEYGKNANSYLRDLTIENLLMMRSGQERSIGGNEWRPLESSWLDAYFRVPFVRQPGTKFMYSSGNSYVLSAIVQRLTGKNCQEYLKELLTDKIGIGNYEWMKSPEGICSGGNGVSLTTEDMARIGMLYLKNGKWNGEQLLSEEWILRSMGRAPEGMKDENGYNYHWRQKENLWSAEGMFGQACVLVPELDMVIALTAADNKNVLVSLLQKEIIIPIKERRALLAGQWEILKRKGLRMTLMDKNTSMKTHVKVPSDSYHFRAIENKDGITDIYLTFSVDKIIYEIQDYRGWHQVVAGINEWIYGQTSMTGAYLHHQYEVENAKVVACAYWGEKDMLHMDWRFPEMVFFDHLLIRWKESEIEVKRWVNMNSEDMERPLLRAVRV